MKISENGLLDLHKFKGAENSTGTFKWFEAEHAKFYREYMAELERVASGLSGDGVGRPIIIGTGGDINSSGSINVNSSDSGAQFIRPWSEDTAPHPGASGTIHSTPGLRGEAFHAELERAWFASADVTRSGNLVTPEEFQAATESINMEVANIPVESRRSRRHGRAAVRPRTFIEELAELDRISSLPETPNNNESNS